VNDIAELHVAMNMIYFTTFYFVSGFSDGTMSDQ